MSTQRGAVQYLKKDSKAKSQIEITPDDYLTNWHRIIGGNDKFIKITVEDIFKDAGLEKLYVIAYSTSSGWLHWDPFNMAEAIESIDSAFIYGTETKYLGAVALSSGFHSLFASAKLLDEHLNLGYTRRLMEVYDAYVAKRPAKA